MPRPRGTPKTGGRKVGTPNKAAPAFKAWVQSYTPAVIEQLARLVAHSKNPRTVIAAARIILDCGYGKVGYYDDEP